MPKDKTQETITEINDKINEDEHNAREIKSELAVLLETIEKNWDKESVDPILNSILDDARDREFYIKQDIELIVNLNHKLSIAEYDNFQKLREAYTRLNEKQKFDFKRKIDDERKRIFTKDFEEYVLESEKLNEEYMTKLAYAKNFLKKGNITLFRKALKYCIKVDRKIVDVLRNIKKFERNLFSLTRVENQLINEG
jgi:hypothetical protein